MNKKYLKIIGIIIALIISAGMLSGKFLFEIIIISLLTVPVAAVSVFDSTLFIIASMVYFLFLILLFVYIYKFLKKNETPFIFNILIMLILFFLGLFGWSWVFFINELNSWPSWGF